MRQNAYMTDHYTALGLRSDAALADVKKAFRQMAALYHPDRNSDADAPARFRSVQEAYEVLADADRRAAYDANRKRNLLDKPLETAQSIWNGYFDPLVEAAR
jgi:DnaJ-class molecular chaperone